MNPDLSTTTITKIPAIPKRDPNDEVYIEEIELDAHKVEKLLAKQCEDTLVDHMVFADFVEILSIKKEKGAYIVKCSYTGG